MAFLRRKIQPFFSTFVNRIPNFPVPKFLHSRTQSNNEILIDAISDSFKKDHTWDTLTRKFISLQLNHSLAEQVLLRLQQPPHSRSALNFFYWSAKTKNLHHHLSSYCIMIHILVRAQQLADAKILLESVLKKNEIDIPKLSVVESLLDSFKVVPSSPLVFDLLVQAYAKLRMLEGGFEVCCYLEEHGFSLSLKSYNLLLHVVQKAGVNCLVWRIYEYMIEKRNYPNEDSTQTMISALCKEGKLQVYVDLVDKIHGKRCSPTVIVNASLMFRIIEECRIEEGVGLLRRMLQKNLILDTIGYSLVVHAKLQLGDLESAWQVFEEMLKRGFSSNSFVYTSFIGAYCRQRRIQEANRLFQEMENLGLKPYDETFNHLIDGCAKAGDMKASASHCEEMIRRGLVPSCCSFNEMVRGLSETGDSKKANDLFTLVLDKGFLPNEITYSFLIAGFGREGDIQEVLKLYHEMEYRSISLGLLVFESLIKSLCQCGKLGEAEKFFKLMKGRSLTPSEDIYEALITSYREMGDQTRLSLLYNEMAIRGFKPTTLFSFDTGTKSAKV
ncbi:hypothetical protein SLA2020_502880 [Shorea laevis]